MRFAREPYSRLLDRTVERHSGKTAIVFRDREITYGELDRLARAFGRALADLGVAKGDRVALYMMNCPEYVVAWYACARIGAVATLVNPSYREDEVAYQLGDSGAVVAVVGEAQALVAVAAGARVGLRALVVTGKSGTGTGTKLLSFDDLVARAAGTVPEVAIDPEEDLLALPYSSGTTGLPKGVMLTHRNVHANNLQFTAGLGVRPESVLLVYLPFYHIYGCMLLGGAVAAGATLVVLERFEPQACLDAIERRRVTHWFAVPPILLHFADSCATDGRDLRSVELVMTGAAPLPVEVGRRFAARTGLRVVQGYGLTEASPLTHVTPLETPEMRRLETVGLPVAGEDHEVVDLENGERPLPPGEAGEVRVRGPHIMKGYWRAPEATAAALRDGWLYTGDVGAIDADGHLRITDRKKEMIKYKGFGVAPAEIEAALHEHPAVADAAVVAKPDPEAGEVPKAFVVLRPGRTATEDEITAFVGERLAGYKKVRAVEFIDAIPRNPSGKILRRVLRQREVMSNE